MAQLTQVSDIPSSDVKRAINLLPIFVIGLASGLVFWVLYVLMKEYIVGYVACDVGTSLVDCNSTNGISSGLALLLASIGGMIALIRWRVLRPLLVILGVIISLWSLPVVLQSHWIIELLAVGVLSGLVYAVFAWFNDLRPFWLAFAVTIVIAIIFRLLTIS